MYYVTYYALVKLTIISFFTFLVFCDFFMSCRHVCSMGRNVRFMRWYHTPYLCHLWVEPTYLCSVHIGFHFRNRCNRVVGFFESVFFSCSKRVTIASKLRTQTREVIYVLDKVGYEKSNGYQVGKCKQITFRNVSFLSFFFFWQINLIGRKHYLQ